MRWVRYDLGDQPIAHPAHVAIAPFHWEERGKKHRLSWPLGSVLINAHGTPAVWRDNFAVVVEGGALTIARADSDRVARLTLQFDPRWRTYHPELLGDDKLHIYNARGKYVLPLDELEALTEGKSRSVPIEIETVWSRRRPDRRVECVYLWKLQSGRTMVEIGDGLGDNHRPKLEIDLPKEYPKHTPIVLFDEVSHNEFRYCEIAGETFTLFDFTPPPLAAKLKLSPADHPEGSDRPVVAQASGTARARIDALLEAIVAEPDVVANREVLVDLLQELEDPAAAVFAALRAGETVSPAKQKLALGPLAPLFVDYETLGGLPIAATLSRSARLADLTEEALTDYRLGLLRALRIGLVNHRVNTQVVSAPAATQLRDIDVTHVTTADALIAVRRDQLTRIGHIDVTKTRLLAKLAQPTFDRVTIFHAFVARQDVMRLLEECIAPDHKGVFSRVPRTLELQTDTNGGDLERALARFAGKLPCKVVVV